jgi:N-acetylglucosaminyl-diphospho-decaprenol L-rhamnosyltransferase
MADLAIVIVSFNDAQWLEACLSSVLSHAGTATLEVVVVDNESNDGTRELVESRFPEVLVVSNCNGGFGHGNNRGIESTTARYVLFLNPDTEVIEGTFGTLVDMLEERPEVGLAGARQLMPDGELIRTIRRFPNASRAFGEALASERWPIHPSWAGERALDIESYTREVECDWTSGSFMLARREALTSAGCFDERFFLYAEEPDLCLRIKQAGWSVRHLPDMTITHHALKGGMRPRMIAQEALARRQYAQKYFAKPHQALYLGAIGMRHLIRAATAGQGTDAAVHRKAARWAIATLLGRAEPPFKEPSPTALQPTGPSPAIQPVEARPAIQPVGASPAIQPVEASPASNQQRVASA